MMRVWAVGCVLAVALSVSSGQAQEADPGGVRRPAGVPPVGGATNPPPPTPRPLTPAELEELRKRMLGGTQGVILKPGEIEGVRRSVQEAQGAANFPGRDGRMPRPAPRLLSVTQEISRSASETLHLAYGVVSPITFVDAKGAPWPIARWPTIRACLPRTAPAAVRTPRWARPRSRRRRARTGRPRST